MSEEVALEPIEVDVSAVKCLVEPRVIGVNVDYLVDHDVNRPAGARPLLEALREMGVKSLRFPGGDKSDNYLWSVPPFECPRPHLACGGPRERREGPLLNSDGSWKVQPMDFDQFMALCGELGAEPTLVVCYDALFTPGCAITREALINTAVAWVEYARKRGFQVKYWEIGNESYVDRNVCPYDYARDFADLARAMKAADSTIRVGANGPPRADQAGWHEATKDTPWWKIVFGIAADLIDFVTVHVYPCWEWKSYEFYRDHSPGYPQAHREAVSAIEAAREWGPPGFADRVSLTVTETNAADWSDDGWPKINDLGHGLVVFDIFGTLLETGRIENAQLWNTRWVRHEPDTPSLWDAVDDMNQLQPTGRALAIWSQFLGEQMVSVSEPERMRTFASYSPGCGRLGIFLINKDTVPRKAAVAVRHYGEAHSARKLLWSGQGPEDRQPVWFGPEQVMLRGNQLEVELPADSLTVIELLKRREG